MVLFVVLLLVELVVLLVLLAPHSESPASRQTNKSLFKRFPPVLAPLWNQILDFTVLSIPPPSDGGEQRSEGGAGYRWTISCLCDFKKEFSEEDLKVFIIIFINYCRMILVFLSAHCT